MNKCKTCGLPYQAGRFDRHRTTFSHRAAIGTGTRSNETRGIRNVSFDTAADNGQESFGARMARLKRERAAGNGSS